MLIQSHTVAFLRRLVFFEAGVSVSNGVDVSPGFKVLLVGELGAFLAAEP